MIQIALVSEENTNLSENEILTSPKQSKNLRLDCESRERERLPEEGEELERVEARFREKDLQFLPEPKRP